MLSRRRFFLFPLVISASLVAGRLEAGDWPRFRGPTASGICDEKGLPTEWGPKKNIAWKRPIPGGGWSSPVVANGRVFLTTAVPLKEEKRQHSLRTIALDAKSGRILWNVEVFKQDESRSLRVHSKNSHASPTPIVDGKRLYVHFGTHGTACLRVDDGESLWTHRDFDYPPVHGSGSTPALVDGLLIFSCDGSRNPFVAALDAKTGDTRWKTPRSPSSGKLFAFCTPLVYEHRGATQVFLPGANWASSYDPKSGKEIWRVRHDGYSVVPRPVFGHGNIYFSSSFDRASMFAVRPGGEGDVSDSHVTWKESKGAPHTPSPLLVGDEVYFISDRGVASCLDAKTGKRHWQGRIGGGHSASPIYADGKIYFQNESGEGTVIRAGKEFEVLAKNDLAERSLASYAISNGSIFIRTSEHLWSVRER